MNAIERIEAAHAHMAEAIPLIIDLNARLNAATADVAALTAERDALLARIAELEHQPPTPPEPAVEAWWRVLHKDGVNIRKGPGTTYAITGALPVGAEIRELERSGDWVRHGTEKWSSTGGDARYMERVEKLPAEGVWFDSPVGTLAERRGSQVWPGTWFDATGFATYYTTVGAAYHTGADLNNNSPAWDSDRLAPVYAAADGVVTHAGKLAGTWGNVVVVEHAPLLHTRYAHLADFTVQAGQHVTRGQQIGRIGNAGGQVAYHLHFDVGTSGVLKSQPGHWPGNSRTAVLAHYADPKAYIQAHRPPVELNPAEALLPHGYALVGAGTADPAEWQLGGAAVDAIRAGKLDAVKLNAPGCTQAVFQAARSANPDLFFVVRLMGNPVSPEQFVNECLRDLRVAYANGVRFFEVHNEPNARPEGYGTGWHDGAGFGRWWVDAVRLLRPEFPKAFFGLPCPSPDQQFQGDRAFWPFLEASERAIRDAGERIDWYGLHVYWPVPDAQGQAIQAVRDFAGSRPGSIVMVTEFSRQPGSDLATKGLEYRAFCEAQYPGEVKALFGFVLHASSGWESERWSGTDIPAIIGRRTTVATAKAA